MAGPVAVDPAARPSDAGRTYEVFGEEYQVLPSTDGYEEEGMASWYGEEFHGRPTASGEKFDMHGYTAAHRTLPLHTWVEVTNLDNGRALILRVNDRGPFARTHQRILDLSYGAARELGVVGPGTARVRVRALGPDEVSRLR
ncbi:MAG TPA: septal ring lytic transglycosylase RlpA family protein [Longimicrobiales bacterium]|nr:septal ring lytic transglycosylase RlpA family protein [Longimicrobiales bacterium]